MNLYYNISIFIVLWYHSLKESFIRGVSSCIDFYRHVRSYKKTWLIFPGYAVPHSAITHMHRITHHTYNTWVYDVKHSTLKQCMDHSTDHSLIVCKLSWLSVKLVVITETARHEYDMDPFFQQFRIHTLSTGIPTLHDIYMSWCISTSYWFPVTNTIQFHLINHLGEERMIPLTRHMISFDIRQRKLYDRP